MLKRIMTNTSLEELALKYNCDKLHSHSYIGFYEKLLEPRRTNPLILLEIGIGFRELMEPFINGPYIHGASLKMFRDYLPNAFIFGCDIREDTLFQEDRIRTFQCDQSVADSIFNLLANISATFFQLKTPDIIIDDGSHQTEHQIFTATAILPCMRPGSLYVIEDVSEPLKVVAGIGEGEIHEFGKRADDTIVLVRR